MFFSDFFNDYIKQNAKVIDPEQQRCAKSLSKIIKNWSTFTTLKKILKPYYKGSSFDGIYIFGPVGSGKTMILNTLSKYLENQSSLRDHFKPFMLDLQRKGYDQKLNECKFFSYILLDELDIIDIADALIIKRFFEDVNQYNIKIILTSNIHPSDLYKNGLHYDRFESFIPYLLKNFYIFKLDNAIDYRLIKTDLKEPMTIKERTEEKSLTILDKNISFHMNGPFITFNFSNLCDSTIGPVHYEELAKQYNFIYVENIPIFNKDKTDSLRRFITLVDFYYDQNKIVKVLPSPHLVMDNVTSLPIERLQSRLIEMFNKNL